MRANIEALPVALDLESALLLTFAKSESGKQFPKAIFMVEYYYEYNKMHNRYRLKQ